MLGEGASAVGNARPRAWLGGSPPGGTPVGVDCDIRPRIAPTRAEVAERLKGLDEFDSPMAADVGDELRKRLTAILEPTRRLRTQLGEKYTCELDFIENNVALALEQVADLRTWPREWVSAFDGAADQRRVNLTVDGDDGEDQAAIRRDEHPGAPTVLVCEDNPELRAFLVDVLGERYNVVAVANGAAGLRHTHRDPPEVIVTDITMPIMGGEKLIAELRRDSTLSQLPVLVLSARADVSVRERLLENGARDYLNKPFGRAELLARVENLVTIRKYAESLEKQVEQRIAQLAEDQERIALELSNTVVQRLFAAGLDLQGSIARARSPELAARLTRTVDELHVAISQIRTTVFNLQSPRDRSDFRDRVQNTIAELTEDRDLVTALRILGPTVAVKPELAAQAEAVLFEAVSNAVRHSGAANLTVEVTIGDELTLSVTDDGGGIPADNDGRGGLAKMERRAERLGGTFHVSTPSAGGTHVRWTAPLAAP